MAGRKLAVLKEGLVEYAVVQSLLVAEMVKFACWVVEWVVHFAHQEQRFDRADVKDAGQVAVLGCSYCLSWNFETTEVSYMVELVAGTVACCSQGMHYFDYFEG